MSENPPEIPIIEAVLAMSNKGSRTRHEEIAHLSEKISASK
ncbi:hypothetical protein [Nostoc sp.]